MSACPVLSRVCARLSFRQNRAGSDPAFAVARLGSLKPETLPFIDQRPVVVVKNSFLGAF